MAEHWADSVYNSLSLEQRIGQLIIARANYSNQAYDKHLDELIKKYNLGGITFFAGDPLAQVRQTNRWNKLAKIPLFVAMDAEWGLGMRLNKTLKYPMQMTLGAISDKHQIYEMGKQVGRQCKRMGININFAPVVDVNNNAKNPIIGMRSFGEDPHQVAERAIEYVKGMQDAGILACAKHFPGHGNTFQDSHKTLPLVPDSKDNIKKIALSPYTKLFDQKKPVSAVMVAHLSIPALEKRPSTPSSLSFAIVSRLLKRKMGFKGLIITDGLDMKAVTQNRKPGEPALEAFKAGNDILLIPKNIPESIRLLRNAIEKNRGLRYRLKESCTKILKYKYLSGLSSRKSIETKLLLHSLNQSGYQRTIDSLYASAITLLQDQHQTLPLIDTGSHKIAIVVLGSTHTTAFEKTLNAYFPVRTFHISHQAKQKDKRFILKELKKYDLAIVCLVNTNVSASRNFGIPHADWAFTEAIAAQNKTILNVFASPYSLENISDPKKFAAIMLSYQDQQAIQEASAQIIAGARQANGKLPISTKYFPLGSGINIPQIRLRFGTPLEVNANAEVLKKIDSIALAGIKIKAYPGCQIVAVKNGVIFYDKAFGYHTYSRKLVEKKTDLYDLASLTKILATGLSMMKLVEEHKINLDDKLSDYLLFLRGTNKAELHFKEVLSHQSGLAEWIPFYREILDDKNEKSKFFHEKITEDYPIRIAQNLYGQKDLPYRITQEIIDSPLGKKEYQYSDLGFYLFKSMIEQMTNQPFDQYVYEHFYKPMGLRHLVFTPRKYFPINQINPTEKDQYFRKQVLVGDVQDQGAALLGGVAGHAGLFGNAEEVAAIMQMLLDGGKYEGRQILQQSVIETFNHRWFLADSNRRGLAFDKPMLKYEDHLSNCKSASASSFGHSGYTGTYMWADPKNGLIYIFLSNRIYPSSDNKLLINNDIRTNIHQLFYDTIKK
jgi:beta-N-acetylhexosaminidase